MSRAYYKQFQPLYGLPSAWMAWVSPSNEKPRQVRYPDGAVSVEWQRAPLPIDAEVITKQVWESNLP